MSKCIVIASGGTGGHLYPTIAVAEEIRKLRPDIRIAFIGTKDRIEAREVPRTGFEFFPIDIQAPGRSIKSLLRFPLKYVRASQRARSILKELDPCAFLGGGAYLSVPVAYAARARKIPVALLEINAVPGRANKVLAGVADTIFVAYQEAGPAFGSSRQQKIEVVGTPVRESLKGSEVASEAGRKHFGLRPDRKTLLVFGGSLGARSLNAAMTDQAQALVDLGYNIIWQTGKSADVDELRRTFADETSIAILEYINEMNMAYAASDLVVARAGASTLAELSTLEKAAILVPYPLAVKNHQEHNARALESAGAAKVILDAELATQLSRSVIALMQDDGAREQLIANIRKRENKDARKVVAQWLVARCTS